MEGPASAGRTARVLGPASAGRIARVEGPASAGPIVARRSTKHLYGTQHGAHRTQHLTPSVSEPLLLVQQMGPELHEVPKRGRRGAPIDLGVGDQRRRQLPDLHPALAERRGEKR